MEKEKILEMFCINKKQESKINTYLQNLEEYNNHTNIVGKSTLLNPWNSHILDSLQILPHIKNTKHSIVDMGSGAGMPGVILSIAGCASVDLVDSNGKKFNFLKIVKKNCNLNFNIFLKRVENMDNKKYDIITSRALANLSKLFSYSQKLIKKNTVLIFLKGKAVKEEIKDAKKKWTFEYTETKSLSDSRGSVLFVQNLKKL